MAIARFTLLAFTALIVLGTSPTTALGQAPTIGFHYASGGSYPNGTVTNPNVELTVSICSDALVTSYNAVLYRPGGSTVNVPLADGMLATCKFTSGEGYLAEFSLLPGDNVFEVFAQNSSGSVIRDLELHYVPQYRAAIKFTGNGEPRLTPGLTLSLPFLVTNTGSSSRTFNVIPSCTGPFTNCNASSSATALLQPQESEIVTVSMTGSHPAGTGTLKVIATPSSGSPVYPDTTSINLKLIAPPTAAPTVVATRPHVSADVNWSMPLHFTITNPDHFTARVVTPTVSCTGGMVCSSLSAFSLPAGRDTTIAVQATWPPTPMPGGGAVKLVVTAVNPSQRDTAFTWAASGSVNPGPLLSLTTSTLNPGTSIARDQCLSIAAGDAAGIECGALRVAHGLSSGVRTMGVSRAPTLVYLSDHARGMVRVAAQYVAQRLAVTDSLHVKMTVARVGQPSILLPLRKYAWAPDCTSSTGCRFVFPVNGVTSSLPTGVYDYTLEVRVGAGGFAKTATGSFVMVNQSLSPFGAGWWLEGLERLAYVSSTKMLWIGGDGSTRVYEKQSDSIYTVPVGQRVTRPDTLKYLGANWYRRLRNGGVVEFDNLYRHIKTTNRQGHATQIAYSGSATVPYSISLPLPTGSAADKSFRFSWTGSPGSEKLTAVHSPVAAGLDSTTLVTISNNQLIRIKEPVGDSIRFAYASTSLPLLTRRYNRLRDSTSFSYDSAYAVKGVTVHLGASPAIATALCPAESRSLVACPIDNIGARPVSNLRVATLLNGPRTDASDLTRFFVGQFGAPDTIVNALGGRVRLEREDATYPALVTQLTDEAGLVTKSSYTYRGLPDTIKVIAPYGAGDAVTTYLWDVKWDMPTRVRNPSGDFTYAGYSWSTGNKSYTRRGTGDSTRVTFGYDSQNRLSWVRPPMIGTSYALQLTYESTLGNVWKSTTALGFTTEALQDAIGRDTSVWTPTDSAQTSGMRTRQSIRYDSRGRADRQMSIAAAQSWNLSWEGKSLVGGAPAITAVVETTYDLEGRPTSVERSSIPAAESMLSTTRYDQAGRVRAKSNDGTSSSDSLIYDQASNLIRTITRRGHHVRQVFDALNRLVARRTPQVTYSQTSCPDCALVPPHIGPGLVKVPYFGTSLGSTLVSPHLIIPEEYTLFSYDLGGRTVQADNRDARVRRAYYANGALKSDTSRIRSASVDLQEPVYTSILNYTYDLTGRRLARSDNFNARQTYTYDALGQLSATTDSVSSQAVSITFAYDAAGRLSSQSVPSAGTVASWTYDKDFRPVIRSEAGFVDEIRYDARGKRIAVLGRALMHGGVEGASLFGFDGLGQLVHSTAGDRDEPNKDVLGVDAQGNVLARWANRLSGFAGAEQLDSSYYQTGRLRQRWGTHFPEGRTDGAGSAAVPVIDSLDIYYDASGNVSYQRQIKTRWFGSAGTGHAERDSSHSWTWNFYDADQRLRASQRTFWKGGLYTDFEEYWYDALGRRIAVRSRADSTCTASGGSLPNRCYQPFVRTVWDGDQVLAEDRGVGGWQFKDSQVGSTGFGAWYGKARYTQTGEIDAPILLWLNFNNPRVLHRNWRGNVAGATFVDDGTVDTETVWPAAYGDIWLAPDALQTPPEPNKWLGSLVTSSKDVTGTLYRRNRYYDPVTGRFTQEDPIGLAGGMNLYGYGAGDPINNSDPFGLCPNPLAMGLGNLQCQLQDALAGARQAWAKAREELGNTVAYVRGSAGIASGQAEVDGTLGAAAMLSGTVGTEAVGVAIGVRRDLAAAPSGSVVNETSVSLMKVGRYSLQVTQTTAVSADGSTTVTSRGMELSAGVARVSGAAGTSVVTPPIACAGSRCPQ